MNFEQKPSQFNKEAFQNNFKNALNEYILKRSDWDSYHDTNEDYDETKQKEIENNISLNIEKKLNQITPIVVEALRTAENKEEILNLINEIIKDQDVYEGFNSLEPIYEEMLVLEGIKTKILQKAIIELLKK